MKEKVVNKSKNQLRACSTHSSAGMDIDKDIIIRPMERTIINKGIYLKIPVGYEAQIRPGSRLAINKRISIVNTPGTIETDYRCEV